MKDLKRYLSLFLAIIMLVTVCFTTLVACDGADTDDKKQKETKTEGPTAAPSEDNTEDPTENNSVDPTEKPTQKPTEKPTEKPDDKVEYTISVQTVGGMPMKDIWVFVHDSSDAIMGYATTDANGEASIKLAPNGSYVAKVTSMPTGYTAKESYAFEENHADVVLTSSVITDDVAPDSYKLGDVMYDFTVTTFDDKREITLSEVLKEKKMMLINYWYDGCAYCLQEFPEMDEMYKKYSDSVEIAAISPFDDDRAIKSFMDKYIASGDLPAEGLTFPVAYDREGIVYKFNPSGAPTSVIVDRYGVVCLIVTGAMSGYEFEAIFKYFTADDYQQQIIEDPSILTPVEKPNIDMPSSDEISNALGCGDLNVNFTPEMDDEDAEYAWPFIVGEKGGQTCIKTSNAFKPGTYSIIYAYVEMKAGQALAFDYWSSTELGNDILYVLVDREAMYQISGDGDGWETCYPYVALEDGVYELSLCYLKDTGSDVGDDTIYIDNLRVVEDLDLIDKETYIFRHAVNDFNDLGSGYNSYVDVVLGADGYYHVGSADGPILLANLMSGSRFGDMSVWNMAYNGLIVVDGKDYVDDIEKFANYSINSKMYGYCSVNEELRQILEKVAEAVGIEVGNEDQWLQMCVYYDAYGTGGKQMEDPIKGLAPFSAYEAKLDIANSVTYTQIIMPRGYLFKFTPEESGVYRITSYSTEAGIVSGVDYAVDAWIFNENHELMFTYEHSEKMWSDTKNVSIIYYMEAGQTYYLDLAYYDIYAAGTFTFRVEKIGDTADIFTLASPGYFTMPDDGDGEIDYGASPEAGGVDVMLVDGKYYVKNADGSQGPALYADFWTLTGLFSHSLEEAVNMGAFNFEKTSLDREIEEYIPFFAEEGIDEVQGFKDLWGEYLYAQRVGVINDVKNGIYHGPGDYTEQIRVYLDQVITDSENVELNGCIEVTEELAEILQTYMDIYTFEDVEHSWTKLCFYYKHYGPTVSVD